MAKAKASRIEKKAEEDGKRWRRAADTLKFLSDATRVQVLLMLREEELNVGAMCGRLGEVSQPAVSHHLALLKHGGLITPRREGKSNIYGLTELGGQMAEVVNALVL